MRSRVVQSVWMPRCWTAWVGVGLAVACTPSGSPAEGVATEGERTTTVGPSTGDDALGSTSSPAADGTTSAGTPGASEGSTGEAPGTSGASESSGTGERLRPTTIPTLITADNRAHDDMHGGWGPHLRAPMRSSDGSLWFAFDGGPGVLSNTTVHYARQTDGVWETVASQMHGPGIQQNAAHVMRGGLVMTYGIDTTQSRLEECYFDTQDPSYAACNTVTIGGAYSTPPNSNYVGAAIGPGDETVVWFTVVGAGGGQGQFVYTYNFGGGWNGPVASALPGYNDMAYVRAHFSAPNQIQWLGQAYVGAYPTGSYAIGVDEVPLGETPTFATLGPAAAAGESIRNAGDIWIDPDTGDAHALARVDGVMHYYFVPSGASWGDHLQPVQTLDGVVRARWLFAPGGPLVMVASGGGINLRWADPGPAIDWNTAARTPVEIPADGFESPSAIYAMGPEYQTAAVEGLHFAVCGQFDLADHEIWHVQVEL